MGATSHYTKQRRANTNGTVATDEVTEEVTEMRSPYLRFVFVTSPVAHVAFVFALGRIKLDPCSITSRFRWVTKLPKW